MRVMTVNDMIEEGSFRNVDGKFDYEQRRAIDLVHQVLNSTSNIYQEDNNVTDLFEIYNEVLELKTNNLFKISMNRSKDCYYNKELIKLGFSKLISNEPNSFIILPLLSDGHMMSTVVRRFGDDISITIVNKGERETYRKQYEEYLIDKKNVPELINFFTSETTEFETEEIYRRIDYASKRKARLKVISNPQKTGNCFIKEPETAIKYAFATKDFSEEDFNRLRFNSKEAPFKPKWDIITENCHRRFVHTLIKQSPVIKNNSKVVTTLINEFNRYKANKRYRKEVRNGINDEVAFLKAFDPKNSFRNMSKEEKIKKLIGALNCDTIAQHPQGIYSLIEQTKDNELKDSFLKVHRFVSSDYREKYLKNEENINSLNEMLSQIEKDFAWATKQLRFEFHLDYIVKAISYMVDDRYAEIIENLDKSNSLYEYNPRNYFLKGVAYSDMAENNKSDKFTNSQEKRTNYEEAIKCYTKAIMLKPDFVDAYVMRSLAYQELGLNDKANIDLKIVHKIDPSSILQLLGKNNNQITKTYKIKTIKSTLVQINSDNLLSGGKKWLKNMLQKFRKMDNKYRNKAPNRLIENFIKNEISLNERKTSYSMDSI